MDDLINLPFSFWTQVSRRKHKLIVFARWHQCALNRGHIGVTWQIRLNRLFAAAMRPYVKLL